MKNKKPLILIPARLQATRLPRKPLINIAGKPLIIHAWEQAKKSDIGDVYVACGEQEIVDTVHDHGGRAILTDPNLPSGTDRIYAALSHIKNAEAYDIIVNFQGDIPLLSPYIIPQLISLFDIPECDIATLAHKILDNDDIQNPNNVKIVGSPLPSSQSFDIWKAHYFSRASIPFSADPIMTIPYFHHIGIYAYRLSALKKFVSQPPTILEQTEKLEQLRALALDLQIYFTSVKENIMTIDTPADLEKIKKYIKS